MPSIRRVVTGHDEHGGAIVVLDELTQLTERRPKTTAAVMWTTEGFPVDNDVFEDTSTREVGTTLANGTVFRILELEPGNGQRMHRTDSVDYAIVMTGEIDMELDGGREVHLNAGDVMVQRGTVHNWVNRGTVPCRIAFVLIDAKPVRVNGQLLEAHG
jgi:mannose-6-phosphate isomerase-like protein (cupin superfamily)